MKRYVRREQTVCSVVNWAGYIKENAFVLHNHYRNRVNTEVLRESPDTLVELVVWGVFMVFSALRAEQKPHGAES